MTLNDRRGSPEATILTNARLVLDDRVAAGSVVIRDGLIASIDEGASDLPGAEDVGGDYLLPGLVELHTDHLERHFTPRPGVRWPAVSAALAHDVQVAGAGITTVFDSLSLIGGRKGEDRIGTLEPMVEGVRQAQAHGMLRSEHLLHLRCEVTEASLLDLLAPFRDDPLVRFISLMDHAPGHRQFSDVSKFRTLYREMFHYPEDEIEQIVARRMHDSRTHGARNSEAMAEHARARGLPLASHDDETAAHVDEARRLGVVLSEFPTTVTAARAAREAGIMVMMGAPNLVRGGSHSGNVSAVDLAADGLIDVLSSDYVPVSLLQGAFMLAAQGYGLPAAVATVAANPARAAGLADRGRIAVGLRADLVQVRVIDGTPFVRQVLRGGRRVA